MKKLILVMTVVLAFAAQSLAQDGPEPYWTAKASGCVVCPFTEKAVCRKR